MHNETVSCINCDGCNMKKASKQVWREVVKLTSEKYTAQNLSQW
jgi:hypothetical protein